MHSHHKSQATEPDEKTCGHANRHMTLQQYAIWEMYRGLGAKQPSKAVAISGAKLASLFSEVSRQTANDITKSLAEAGWLEIVRGKTMIAADKSKPIEYRPVNHAEWVLKHPDGCSKLNSDRQAGQHRRKGRTAIERDTDQNTGQSDRQAGIVDQNTGMVDRQSGQSDRYTGQSDRQAGHISLLEPSNSYISKPTNDPIRTLEELSFVDVPTDGNIDIRDLHFTGTTQERTVPMQAATDKTLYSLPALRAAVPTVPTVPTVPINRVAGPIYRPVMPVVKTMFSHSAEESRQQAEIAANRRMIDERRNQQAAQESSYREDEQDEFRYEIHG